MLVPRRHAAALWLTLILLIVWSIPHTVALRYTLMTGLALCVFSVPAVRQAVAAQWRSQPALWIYLALSAWLLIQIPTVAMHPQETLEELRGQWLKSSLALLLGMGLMQLARTTPGSSRAVVFNRVFVALGLAVWIQGADYLWAWLVLGEPSFNSTGVFNGKVQVSYLANLFLSLCMAEAFSRVCGGGRYVAVSSPLLAAWALCAVAVTFFSGARNGLIGVVLLCVSTGLLMLYYAPSRIRPWQRLGGFALLLCVAAGLAGAQLKTDTRWARFIESTSYSFQTDTVLSWLDPKRYPYPILSDGQPLDDSAYERTAWIIVGMKLSAEHKLGVGFTRKAYTNTVMDKYGVLVRHSHSGLVEYTLGMGWPGIALWAAFLLTVFSQGLRRLLRKHDTLALASMFLVSGFAGRMIIENVTRDHMMEMFMFLIGLMLAALVRPAQAR